MQRVFVGFLAICILLLTSPLMAADSAENIQLSNLQALDDYQLNQIRGQGWEALRFQELLLNPFNTVDPDIALILSEIRKMTAAKKELREQVTKLNERISDSMSRQHSDDIVNEPVGTRNDWPLLGLLVKMDKQSKSISTLSKVMIKVLPKNLNQKQ